MNPAAGLRHRLNEAFVRWALRVRPPEAAPIVLTQNRVYVLPTRAGIAFAVALGVILLGAMNYNLSLGYALVFLLGGLGIVAILHTFRNLALLSIRPGRCDPVFAGATAQFDIVLENPRREPRTSLSVSVGGGTPIEVDVGARAGATATLGVHAERRGWLPLPRLTIETAWPLGLVRAWSYAVPDQRCLVYPQPAAKAPPLPWSGDAARGTTREGRGSDDFSGLRRHQPADPPHHIAWKAAARQENAPLLTKQFAGATAEQIWLDWDALPNVTDGERRLSILARWMLDAEAAGLAWGLRLPGQRLPPSGGAAQLAAGLRALALFEYGPG